MSQPDRITLFCPFNHEASSNECDGEKRALWNREWKCCSFKAIALKLGEKK